MLIGHSRGLGEGEHREVERRHVEHRHVGLGRPASGKLVTALVEGGMRGWTVVDMKDDRNPVFSD